MLKTLNNFASLRKICEFKVKKKPDFWSGFFMEYVKPYFKVKVYSSDSVSLFVVSL